MVGAEVAMPRALFATRLRVFAEPEGALAPATEFTGYAPAAINASALRTDDLPEGLKTMTIQLSAAVMLLLEVSLMITSALTVVFGVLDKEKLYDAFRSSAFVVAVFYGLAIFLRNEYLGYYANEDYIIVLAFIICLVISFIYVYLFLVGVVALGVFLHGDRLKGIVAVLAIIPTILGVAVNTIIILKSLELIPSSEEHKSSSNTQKEAQEPPQLLWKAVESLTPTYYDK